MVTTLGGWKNRSQYRERTCATSENLINDSAQVWAITFCTSAKWIIVLHSDVNIHELIPRSCRLRPFWGIILADRCQGDFSDGETAPGDEDVRYKALKWLSHFESNEIRQFRFCNSCSDRPSSRVLSLETLASCVEYIAGYGTSLRFLKTISK